MFGEVFLQTKELRGCKSQDKLKDLKIMIADCFYGSQHLSSMKSTTCVESNHFIHQ